MKTQTRKATLPVRIKVNGVPRSFLWIPLGNHTVNLTGDFSGKTLEEVLQMVQSRTNGIRLQVSLFVNNSRVTHREGGEVIIEEGDTLELFSL